MSGFDADAAALWVAGRQLETVADDLDADAATARAQVERLLDGGWVGGAAAAYGVAWREWESGFTRAVSALREMARLLGDTGSEYDRADHAARSVVLDAGAVLR